MPASRAPAHVVRPVRHRPLRPRGAPAPPAAPSSRRGWVYDVWTDQQHRAYLALTAIPCGRCGALIPPGALFTRARASTRAGSGPAPCCWHCKPFALDRRNLP
jgi:hypothetical protein